MSTQQHVDARSEEQRKAEEEERDKRLSQTLMKIRYTIMVMSGKGGVGKSTVAVNLAAVLAKEGHYVGMLDADIHGPDVPKMWGVDWRPLGGGDDGIRPVEVLTNVKLISMAFLLPNPDSPVVWRGPLKHVAIKQFLADVKWGELDYLIVDLPPGTGDEPLSVAHLIEGVDGSVIVTTPQDVALLDSRKAVNFSRMLKVPVIGIVENMSGLRCPKCGHLIPLFKIGGGEKAAKDLKVPFLGRIPIDPEVVQGSDSGTPHVVSYPDSEVTKAFEEIAEKCKVSVESHKEGKKGDKGG
ncbi:MAG: Mrp/NBP35 family ATP-binding protein [Deltaproteobacteria bacterium]|nr:Mrp/NBP35 family ATP-binding protein [Deltaproteobacteria bacterium]